MLYPFIYLRVYYRGFQDSLFPRWPDFLASRGYGGSMATHGPSVLAGPRSKFCGLHSPPHPLGHGLAGVSRQRLYHGWWMLVVQCCVFWEVSNLSNDPMLCFFPDSYLEWGWRWRWWYDWWWLMMINGFEFGRNPGRLIFREETRKGHDSLPRGILGVFVEFRGQPDLFLLPGWLFEEHVRPHW